MISTTIQRLYLIEGYDQVFLDDSPRNPNGTCYNGGQTRSPCLTIGVFNEEIGLPTLDTSAYREESGSLDVMWNWASRALLGENDQHIGSPAPEEYIAASLLRPEICEEINRRLHGSPDVPVMTTFASSYGQTVKRHRMNGSYSDFVVSPSGSGLRFGLNSSGCGQNSDDFTYSHIIKQQ